MIPKLSSEKSISAVIFKASDNPGLSDDVTGVITSDSVKILFPQGISLSNLIPTISFSGKSINPSNHTAQNFITSLIYTITAEDGTTKNFIFKINRIDSVTLLSGNWHVLRDSLSDTDNFYTPGVGHPTPGVYYGTASDYYDFNLNGVVSIHENGVTGSSTYQLLSNNKLSITVFDIYDPATIETLSTNIATFFWEKTGPSNSRYFRKLYLKK